MERQPRSTAVRETVAASSLPVSSTSIAGSILNSPRCFQLMRTDDPALFAVWIRAWSDLTDFEVIPVRTSAEAAAAIRGER